MAVCPSDFLSFSSALLEIEDSEIFHRNVISRSYYAIFLAARNLADRIHVPPISDLAGGSHENTRVYFQNNLHTDLTLRRQFLKVGHTLRALHEKRCSADYELDADISRTDAEAQFSKSLSITNVLSDIASHYP